MKTILLPLHDDDTDPTAIAIAYAIAVRFDSYVEGLFVRATLPMVPRGPVPPHYLSQYAELWDESAENARKSFAAFMGEHKVPFRDTVEATARPTAWWQELDGRESEVLASYARLFDVTVVGRSGNDFSGARLRRLETTLFDSGRPVMVGGSAPPETMGRTIVIAWNGSTETARTIAFGMPFLAGAETVSVLSVSGAAGGMVPGPTGEQVAANLVRKGINAVARTVAAEGRSSGQSILEEAAAIGADLLFKGAYSHRRLREMIFGGTTRHVLFESSIPVLTAH